MFYKEVIFMTITKQSIIGDILDACPDTAQFFFEIGMHCLGCPASRGESVEDACKVHGTDADALVEKINKYLEGRGHFLEGKYTGVDLLLSYSEITKMAPESAIPAIKGKYEASLKSYNDTYIK